MFHSRQKGHWSAATVDRVPRVLRTLLPDGLFHVHTLGVADTVIYRDDEDRRSWLQIFRSAVRRYEWKLHIVCLMSTHYHFVLESRCERLSDGMQWLNGLYAATLNAVKEDHGHVFGARYGSTPVTTDSYLLEVLRYIALNPVRAGLVARPLTIIRASKCGRAALNVGHAVLTTLVRTVKDAQAGHDVRGGHALPEAVLMRRPPLSNT